MRYASSAALSPLSAFAPWLSYNSSLFFRQWIGDRSYRLPVLAISANAAETHVRDPDSVRPARATTVDSYHGSTSNPTTVVSIHHNIEQFQDGLCRAVEHKLRCDEPGWHIYAVRVYARQ
jgi:hypothetical protein